VAAPLEGIVVFDLTRFNAGPTCTALLGDMGADVIKVEPLPAGDYNRSIAPLIGGEAVYFLTLNRNKRSAAIDFRHPRAGDIFRALARKADVLVESFKPGVARDMGIDYASVRRLNPRLVYCSISGFGQTGPYRERPGVDQIAQAMSGIMSITGTRESGPLRVGLPVGDRVAGFLATLGIVLALYERQRSGLGQQVESTLLEALLGLHTFQAGQFLLQGHVPAMEGNDHPLMAPSGVFRTADGFMSIAAANEPMWRKLCDALDLPDLTDDPRFRTNTDRVGNRAELTRLLEARLAQATKAAWVERLTEHDICCGPVYDLGEAFSDPHVLARGMVQEVEHAGLGRLKLPGIPIKLGRTPGAIRRPPPRLGEHTDEVLRWAGFSEAEVADLRAAKAIGRG
jgi:crotonobetainyl-CoA:carnitine CoA-transferase CaiB-like acyl-CoA transferase